MSPILGIYASQISGHLSTNNFSSIATVTVGSGGASSVTFSSIPSTYTHLQIRCSVMGNTGISSFMQFNGDTGTNYVWHTVYGNGSTASSNSGTSQTGILANGFNQGFSTTYPTVAVIDILDYANTNKYKVTRNLNGQDWNGSGSIDLASGLWQNTAAINSITIYTSSFTNYSSFALYGIR
jgi:hypothetical protein